MKILKISLVSIIVVVTLAVLILANSLGSIAKKGIESVAPGILGVNVTVDAVDISIMSGKAKITGLSVGNPEGFKSDRAFYLGEVNVALEPLSIFSNVIKIDHIKIIKPEITYEVGAGKTNIGQLQKNIGGKSSAQNSTQDASSESKSSSESKTVVINEILASDAKIKAGMGEINKSVPLPEIKLENIGTQDQPASFVSATRKLLSAVVTALSKTDLSDITGGIINKIKETGGSITEGIKGLFK